MSMYNWLERLQQKPDSYKRRVIIASSAAVIVVIGGVWLATLKDRMAFSGPFIPAETEEERAEEPLRVSGPLASLKDTLGAGLSGLQEQFSAVREELGGGQDTRTEPEDRAAFPLPTETQ